MRQTLDDASTPLSPTGYASTPFGVVRSGAEPDVEHPRTDCVCQTAARVQRR